MTESLASARKIEQQVQNEEEKGEGLDRGYLKSDLESKIKEDLEKSDREQHILLKEYKQNIINFLLENKESIRLEDLKIYEPIYKCYREKGYCDICNSLTNISCKSCNNSHYSHYNNKEVWLYINHWK